MVEVGDIREEGYGYGFFFLFFSLWVWLLGDGRLEEWVPVLSGYWSFD